MSETKRCPKCRGRMTKRPIEVETTDTGVRSWRIPGTELLVYVCGKCGYVEFYDREKMKT
jgi:predicted nucleic-acid-binding Zn-ribbon protein